MEDYNWNLVLKVSVPFSLAVSFLFYSNFKEHWKWILLVIALSLTGLIVYFKDKRKNSIFTAVGIVFLAALVMRFLKNSGFL